MKAKAICIAEAGYGTGWYNLETNECYYECYANIKEVILNEEYWSQYDDMLDQRLNSDFDLGMNFNEYKLIVYEDGSKEAIFHE